MSSTLLLFSCSVVSNSLWPCRTWLQHVRLPCPSLSPRVCSNSCPLSWWCHLTICPSVTPFSSCPQFFPSSGSFPTNWLFTSRWPKYCGFSFSISPSSEYSGLISFSIEWFNLLAVKGTLKSLIQHYSLKAWFLGCSTFFMVQLSHSYMTIGKTISLTKLNFVGKVTALLFTMLSMFLRDLLPRANVF